MSERLYTEDEVRAIVRRATHIAGEPAEMTREIVAYQIAKDNLELRLFKTTKALRALFEEPTPYAIPKQAY